MTPEQLIAEARALAAEATPGPWTKDARYVVGEVPGGRPGGEVIIECQPTRSRLDGYTLEMRKANAAFIARGRTLVPELADAALDLLTQLAAATAENERLREALQRIARSDHAGETMRLIAREVLAAGPPAEDGGHVEVTAQRADGATVTYEVRRAAGPAAHALEARHLPGGGHRASVDRGRPDSREEWDVIEVLDVMWHRDCNRIMFRCPACGVAVTTRLDRWWSTCFCGHRQHIDAVRLSQIPPAEDGGA